MSERRAEPKKLKSKVKRIAFLHFYPRLYVRARQPLPGSLTEKYKLITGQAFPAMKHCDFSPYPRSRINLYTRLKIAIFILIVSTFALLQLAND
jgi:hypothetical protein